MIPRHRALAFTEAAVDGRTLRLRYALVGGPDPDVPFEEQLVLPDELPAPSDHPVTRALLDGVHRAFGVSYFKAAVPAEVEAEPVPEEEARFWDTLYTEGMGEFYYRNGLDPRGRVRFPRGGERVRLEVPPVPERALVLAGGGKDSAVACEVVRHAGVAADAFSLGTAPWLGRSVGAMGLRHVVVRRRIDPALLALNARGAYNGHVPISACIAFLATLVAWLGDYSAIVVANERSADEGNVRWNDVDVNHQWSKSLRFEAGFQDLIAARVAGAPRYFSLLRPLGELGIGAAFATHPRYFDDFTSCNANFRLSGGEVARWCGRCPKCVFVALALGPNLPDAAIDRIFGTSPLADPENRGMIEALCGVTGFKPFECVGTVDESRTALARLAGQGRLPPWLASWWTGHPALHPADPEAAWASALRPSPVHRLPALWEDRLHAYLDARR